MESEHTESERDPRTRLHRGRECRVPAVSTDGTFSKVSKAVNGILSATSWVTKGATTRTDLRHDALCTALHFDGATNPIRLPLRVL